MNTLSVPDATSAGLKENKANGIAIISLRPKEPILHYVRHLAKEVLHEADGALNKILDQDYLEEHSVPVCTKVYLTPNDLEGFLQSHCDVLVNLMLTSWMWPIEKWGFNTQEGFTIKSLMATEYRPFVYLATDNIKKSPHSLAVTYANPTREFVEYLAHLHSARGGDAQALANLGFRVRSGLAIITDSLDRNLYRDSVEHCVALGNSLNYLKPLSNDVGKKLLLTFCDKEQDLPEHTDVNHLNKWFNFHTNLGIYMLTEPWMASRYRRCMTKNDLY